MNILPTTILPATVSGVNALAAAGSVLAAAQTLQISALDTSSSVVELSRLAEFQSTLAAAQKKLRELQASPATTGASQAGFDLLNSATQGVIDAYNNLQTTATDGSQLPFDAQAGTTLNAQLTQALSPSGNTPVLASLSQLGVTLQTAPTPDTPASLSVDVPALQAAFNADQNGTTAVLTQAAGALDTLGMGLAQQISDFALAANASAQQDGATPAAGAPVAGSPAALISAAGQPAGTDIAVVPQNSLADMALIDLLAENPHPATAATAAQLGAIAPQAAPVVAAPQTAPAVQAAPAILAPIEPQVQPTGATPLTTAQAPVALADTPAAVTTNAAAPLAQDPAVAAAIAAYHLNDNPFNTINNDLNALAAGVANEVIPVVAPVPRVKAAQKIS
ncbi:hypothetical protein AAKU55_001993 [Oxalobacteraceae bacterium GrIS 1.11]